MSYREPTNSRCTATSVTVLSAEMDYGFLYLDNGKEIQFRGPGDIERDIKQIAPEELAAGMLEILKQNVTADKSGLYRSLAAQCGVTRVGKAINEAMDAALNVLLQNNSIVTDGDQISLK